MNTNSSSRYDAVIVGGGHNGLVAAAYLARAGQRVVVLERLPHTGGAAVSARVFTGVDARLSRYSYLVSLLPRKVVRDLGLRLELRRRRIASYSPTVRDGKPAGLLVDAADPDRTRESFRALTGADREWEAWRRFYGMTGEVARHVFPTLTEPLPSRAELRRRVGDDATWEALFERPLGETIERTFADDLVRGVVLTDALIGTFTHAHDPSLRQNRCFLYHVIGNGTGDWDVPVGGMGAVTGALAKSALGAGAELRTGCEVTAIATDGFGDAEVTYRHNGAEFTVVGRRVLVNAAPATLARLLGEEPGPAPEGAQLKVNMVLRRLPRLRDASVDPRDAFAGTFHIAEGYRQLETAYAEAAAGRMPSAPPSEIYCHTLTDSSILGPEAIRQGFHTLTLFGLHMPARLFKDPAAYSAAKEHALASSLAQLDEVLAEPIADCLATDADGRPCVEARTPLDLEREISLPGGHIFHRDLSFPFTDEGVAGAAARWGVATAYPNVLLCGAGMIRGGGVSGIPGHNAAQAVLEDLTR
ncbi:NAD(P)/FAD-dependent oxidoreductase [Streptomyces kaniharaensis]|uniref:Pyridine nucleotide-disulfide oxidoreductase domain-containing protein 2 n=1 Tax=Streptomyces kaniharaensis TaxID=212423 RepID=A0A6N7L016_9ACTN|nr:NAD(P)/FAD-dependent oxidoreductase [Streptomyces kaniharaensis]MQS15888.1 NAD(P)/FAD-dependent oxidoreductase [Streptomyces kaniharaensis]